MKRTLRALFAFAVGKRVRTYRPHLIFLPHRLPGEALLGITTDISADPTIKGPRSCFRRNRGLPVACGGYAVMFKRCVGRLSGYLSYEGAHLRS
jgi:hypothetical protein